MSFSKGIASQITFLYYEDLNAARHFYADTLGLAQVEDQGWAKIFRINDRAFLGIVDETKGSLQAQETNAVMITLVVEDVAGWHAYLQEAGAKIRTEPKVSREIQIEYFFAEDPGGYVLEFQRFLAPATAELFGLPVADEEE